MAGIQLAQDIGYALVGGGQGGCLRQLGEGVDGMDPALDPAAYAAQYPPGAAAGTNQGQGQPPPLHPQPLVDLDSETDSNHDTALTLACAGGHEELVTLLLDRGADIGEKRTFAKLSLKHPFQFKLLGSTRLKVFDEDGKT